MCASPKLMIIKENVTVNTSLYPKYISKYLAYKKP